MRFTYEDKLKIVEDYEKLGLTETSRKWNTCKRNVLTLFTKYKNSCLVPHSKINKKYSPEVKIEVVNAYIQGEGSFEALANKFGISTYASIRTWYHIYQSHGEEGLRNMKCGRPSKSKTKSTKAKVNVDKLLQSEKSFSDYSPEEEKALKEELLRLRCHEEFSKKIEALAQDYLEKKSNK